jgi:hypothetical protein
VGAAVLVLCVSCLEGMYGDNFAVHVASWDLTRDVVTVLLQQGPV